MSVAKMFQDFSTNLTIGTTLRGSIASRVGRMVKCLNEDFRSTSSDSANRFYVGSYGRNTAIPTVSDVDVVFALPASTYHQYSAYSGNKQSSLLQALRASVRRTYPASEIAADGQVIVVNFTDNIKFEILGAFRNTDGSYTFADSNAGGSWRICKPKHELDAFSTRDIDCSRNLVQLGRMARAWRNNNSVAISGMLIDTLAYQFIAQWAFKDKSYLYYDYLTRDFMEYLSNIDTSKTYWLAPGSGSYVYKSGNFQSKAKAAHTLALSAIAHLGRNEMWSAHYDYRSIYGTSFPAHS